MTIYPTHRCFDDALEFIELSIKANPACKEYFSTNMIIVHAICLMPDAVGQIAGVGEPGSRYAHAWVEDTGKDTCIFCGIINGKRTFLTAQKAEYYEHFQVQETTRYTLMEAAKKNIETTSYGPWEEKYKALTRSAIRERNKLKQT